MPPKQSSPTMQYDIDSALRCQFHKEHFRPSQREIIEATLGGHDVYVQAATSFGKSLCFQLPAVITPGRVRVLIVKCKVTIVVSPLLSLMTNQVEALRNSGIAASSLNKDTSSSERNRILSDIDTGQPQIKLLYVTPELCARPHFRERLQALYRKRQLARIAIDEAHCISEWGHDFRTDFQKLSWFREAFPSVPIMCLTATANQQVRKDIMSALRLDASPDKTKMFLMSPQRSNLHMEIRFTNDEDGENGRIADFLRWIRSVYSRRRADDRIAELTQIGERPESVPGIIYTVSRDECEKLASALRDEGIGAQPFHAKLSPSVKSETLSRWIENEPGYDVIVATTAFGMGIDKENVRFVVHWRLPKSFEGYYQEAGRAGRDGNASYCFLYYSREDLERNTRMIRSDSRDKGSGTMNARLRSLQALALYCENITECRHSVICSYFGERPVYECDYACDFHKDPHNLRSRFMKGLASEEFVSTQAMQGTYDDAYYDS
ncbi:unnamed protein product [Clonostachys rosea f. rosea IK726]|uniref:ATP-dependent DNA helicase n=2 Tax=Bionectria ochroleuca TaxID=29856 RepID=A0A0B7JLM7_BIOOC|nr:unnamed protein product [Clonostachys rosea f. rosea IK726]